MKRIIMFVLLFAALKVAGQTTGYLRFDTVRIMKQNGTCELYIINKTKDSLGVLTNIGGGLTQFKRSKALNDSTFIIGFDTITIHGITPGSTLPAFTPGSVLFGREDGGISEDNANFFYDSTNSRLGIGGTPTSRLYVEQTGDAGNINLLTLHNPGTSASTSASLSFGIAGATQGRIRGYYNGSGQSTIGLRAATSGSDQITLAQSGRLTLGSYAALATSTDTTTYKPLGINSSGDVFKIDGWPVGGASGGGISYKVSATAPTGSDTSKIWIQTPDKAGVYDVWIYVTTQFSWNRFGWLSLDGVFSTRRPFNIAMCGQSNAAGIGPGGDTSWVKGIIAFGSPAGDGTSTDYQTEWHQARINKSPFYSSNNNISFQVAKNIVRHGDADIVRIITTYEGGTSLDSWIKGSNGTVLLDTFRNRLTRSGIDTLDAFLWHQGESGGVTGFTLGGYVVDQRVFYDSLCSNLTRVFKRNWTRYIAGGLADTTYKYLTLNRGSPESAQRGLNFDGNLFTGFASSFGLSNIGDNVHFSGTAIDSFGFRYYSVMKSLPHNTYEEEPPFTWDSVYDQKVAFENLITDYNGGPSAYKRIGAGFGWRDNTNNPLLTIIPGTVSVGGSYGAGTRSFTVAGAMSVFQGNYNLNISTNFNPTGDPERNVFLTNHSSNFTASSGNDAVIMGYNAAGVASGPQPSASVIIGSEALYNGVASAFGGLYTVVGFQAGHGAAGYGLTASGYQAGKNTQGAKLTCYGINAAALNTSAYTNSSAIGADAKFSEDSGFVVGNALKRFIIGGTTVLPFLVGTPSSNDLFKWNSSTGQFELGQGLNISNAALRWNGNYTQHLTSHDFELDSAHQVWVKIFEPNEGIGPASRMHIGMRMYPDFSTGISLFNNFRKYDNSGDSIQGSLSISSQRFLLSYNNTVTGKTSSVFGGPGNLDLIGSDSVRIQGLAISTSADTIVTTLRRPGSAYDKIQKTGINDIAGVIKVNNITTNTTIDNSYNLITIDATSGNVTITLPAASVSFGSNRGRKYVFKRMDNSGNTITIQRDGSDTIDGGTNFTLTTQYEAKELAANSTSSWVLF